MTPHHPTKDPTRLLSALPGCPDCDGDGFVVPMGAPDRLCYRCVGSGKDLDLLASMSEPVCIPFVFCNKTGPCVGQDQE